MHILFSNKQLSKATPSSARKTFCFLKENIETSDILSLLFLMPVMFSTNCELLFQTFKEIWI